MINWSFAFSRNINDVIQKVSALPRMAKSNLPVQDVIDVKGLNNELVMEKRLKIVQTMGTNMGTNISEKCYKNPFWRLLRVKDISVEARRKTIKKEK